MEEPLCVQFVRNYINLQIILSVEVFSFVEKWDNPVAN